MLRPCLLLISMIGLLTGCQTLEESLASRVGCDSKKLSVEHQLHVPAYTQYEFTCEGKKHTCRDAPFYSSCTEGWHRDGKGGKGGKGEDAAKPAKKKG